MKRTIFAIAALVLTCAAYCQELTIIHMNDTHSHIDPERAGEHKGRGGVIEQAAFIDSVRYAAGKRNVLLVHAGDFSQGSSYFTELGGDMEIDVLNLTGYDVVALGNHEFDNGAAELSRRLKNLKPEVVCANYDFTDSPLEGLVKPYAIVRKAGQKIGVIGLLTDISKVVDRSLLGNLKYQEPAPVVNALAEFLKHEKGCDLVICLSHLGYMPDRELAGQTRNVDIIIGGHSHTHLNELQKVSNLDGKETVVVQNWCWGLEMAELKVKL